MRTDPASTDQPGIPPTDPSGAPATAADDAKAPHGVSRRGLLGLIGAGAAGLAVGGGTGAAIGANAASASSQRNAVYPFHGAHQAGITTPVQDRLHFASFDLSDSLTRDDLVQLLKDWTAAAAKMTAGQPVGETGAVDGPEVAPPEDTGEALDLPAAGLTITFGFGPTLFQTTDGRDRFGLASRRPAALAVLPRFSGDNLSPEISGGDIAIQACADDPQVAVHAIRNLSRIAFGRASIRWSQLGFGRTSSTSTSQSTARNLMGFKDGTANVKAEDPKVVDAQVWADGDPSWMAGGSYLVTRKIRMIIETWDRAQLQEQERVIGRNKGAGAPLSGGAEFTAPDFSATGATGKPLIDKAAHVRLAHPDQNKGTQLLRRGYNYVDGNDQLGRLDAGLFFISYQRDPQQFIDIQRSLATDALKEYIRHVGSAVFAVPPGAKAGDFIGQQLFA